MIITQYHASILQQYHFDIVGQFIEPQKYALTYNPFLALPETFAEKPAKVCGSSGNLVSRQNKRIPHFYIYRESRVARNRIKNRDSTRHRDPRSSINIFLKGERTSSKS